MVVSVHVTGLHACLGEDDVVTLFTAGGAGAVVDGAGAAVVHFADADAARAALAVDGRALLGAALSVRLNVDGCGHHRTHKMSRRV
eukprot:gene51982-46963_t